MNQAFYEKYVDIDQFFEEAKQILKEYICPLCGGVFNDPRSDTCGHLFCRKCIKISLEKSGGKCPLSDSMIKEEQLSEQKFVSNILNKQKLYCSNRHKGCLWSDLYQNLSFHLDQECLKQDVKCKNTGCSFISAKENISNHYENCEYRVLNCEHCLNLFPFNELEIHFLNCPNILVDCEKKCGRKVERKFLDSHYESECENTEVICLYSKYGCCYMSERRNLKDHLDNQFSFHQSIILKEVLSSNDKLREKVSDLENENNIIFNRLVSFEKKLEEIQSHKFVFKSNTNKEFSQLNKKIMREELKSNKLDEKIEKEEMKTYERDEKYDQFDLKNLPIGILIDQNKLTSEPTGKKNTLHRFVFGLTELNNSEFKWRIRVLKISHWFGFGVCQKDRTILSGYKFFKGKEKEINHGTFIFSSNGYCWNGNQMEEDNIALKNFIQPKPGDVISLNYKLKTCELICQINQNTYKLSKVVAGNDKLVPCFIFLFNGDEVKIEYA